MDDTRKHKKSINEDLKGPTGTPKKQKLCSQSKRSIAGRLPMAPLTEIFSFTIYPYPETFSLPRMELVCKSWRSAARKPNLWAIALKIRFPRVFLKKLKLYREAVCNARNSAAAITLASNSTPSSSANLDNEMKVEEKEEREAGSDSWESDSDGKEEEEDSFENIPEETPEELQGMMKSINVRESVQGLSLKVSNYQKTIAFVEEKRQKGNDLFKEGSLNKALDCYVHGFTSGEQVLNGEEEAAAPLRHRVELRHLLATVCSNCSATFYRMNLYERAAKWGVRGHQRLIGITRVLKDNATFSKLFGELNRKIQRRIRQALAHVIPRISLVRHSDVRVEGVGVGTVLSSNRNMGGSIFDNSRVILYQHEPGEGCAGVVLNKRAVMPDGKTRRMGGPVDPRQRVYLHNVADLPGATRVVEGVYHGGDIEEAKQREGARIETFYGYAAWFDGQLDGEIRNEDWTWTNDASADLVFDSGENDDRIEDDEKIATEIEESEAKEEEKTEGSSEGKAEKKQ